MGDFMNCEGRIAHEGNGGGLGKLYCGARFAPNHGCPCGTCDGRCGPNNGCACPPCKALLDSVLSRALCKSGHGAHAADGNGAKCGVCGESNRGRAAACDVCGGWSMCGHCAIKAASERLTGRCPKGHALESISATALTGRIYYSSGYKCDGCGRRWRTAERPTDETVRHCQSCSFDLCPECAKPRACPAGHVLEELMIASELSTRSGYSGGYNCDGCGKECDVGDADELVHHCAQCSYDICPNCSKKAPAASAEAIRMAASSAPKEEQQSDEEVSASSEEVSDMSDAEEDETPKPQQKPPKVESKEVLEMTVVGRSEAIPPTTVEVAVIVSGFLAETRVTMVFKNDGGEDLEGELTFPLEEGAAVCGYAVDVNGQMVDAVVVEKEKARVAFETEVREKRAGPAIAESVAGNMFRTKIYPLPAHGSRTVRVCISSTLSESQSRALYACPLRTRSKLSTFTMSAQIDTCLDAFCPPVLSDDVDAVLGKHTFDQDASVSLGSSKNARFTFKASRDDVSPPGALEVSIPRREKLGIPPCSILVEAGHPSDISTSFFCISDTVAAPLPSLSSGDTEAARPRRFGIIWDKSRSCDNGGNGARCFGLIQGIAAHFPDLEEILLFTFSDSLLYRGTFRNGLDLTRFLNTLNYDGATNFSSLNELPQENGIAFYVLFSDGFNSWGDNDKVLPKDSVVPIHTVCCSEKADFGFLKRVASSTAGTFFNFSKAQDNEPIVDTIVGGSGMMFLRADFNANQIDEFYPSSPVAISPDGVFRMAGKLPNHNDDVTLTVHFGKTQSKVLRTVQYVLSPSRASTGLLSRFWAQQKIDAIKLLTETDATRAQVLALGRTFGIVTSDSSLIVLNTLDQWLKYDIEPPAALLDIRREWLIRIKEKQAFDVQRREKKFSRVCRAWKRRVTWWSSYPTAEEAATTVQRPLIRHFMDATNRDMDQDDRWGQPSVKLQEPPKRQPSPVSQVSPPSQAIQAPASSVSAQKKPGVPEAIKGRTAEIFREMTGAVDGSLIVQDVRTALEEITGFAIADDAFTDLTRRHGVAYSGFCDAETFAEMAHECSGDAGLRVAGEAFKRRDRMKQVEERKLKMAEEDSRRMRRTEEEVKRKNGRAGRFYGIRMDAEPESETTVVSPPTRFNHACHIGFDGDAVAAVPPPPPPAQEMQFGSAQAFNFRGGQPPPPPPPGAAQLPPPPPPSGAPSALTFGKVASPRLQTMVTGAGFSFGGAGPMPTAMFGAAPPPPPPSDGDLSRTLACFGAAAPVTTATATTFSFGAPPPPPPPPPLGGDGAPPPPPPPPPLGGDEAPPTGDERGTLLQSIRASTKLRKVTPEMKEGGAGAATRTSGEAAPRNIMADLSAMLSCRRASVMADIGGEEEDEDEWSDGGVPASKKEVGVKEKEVEAPSGATYGRMDKGGWSSGGRGVGMGGRGGGGMGFAPAGLSRMRGMAPERERGVTIDISATKETKKKDEAPPPKLVMKAMSLAAESKPLAGFAPSSSTSSSVAAAKPAFALRMSRAAPAAPMPVMAAAPMFAKAAAPMAEMAAAPVPAPAAAPMAAMRRGPIGMQAPAPAPVPVPLSQKAAPMRPQAAAAPMRPQAAAAPMPMQAAVPMQLQQQQQQQQQQQPFASGLLANIAPVRAVAAAAAAAAAPRAMAEEKKREERKEEKKCEKEEAEEEMSYGGLFDDGVVATEAEVEPAKPDAIMDLFGDAVFNEAPCEPEPHAMPEEDIYESMGMELCVAEPPSMVSHDQPVMAVDLDECKMVEADEMALEGVAEEEEEEEEEEKEEEESKPKERAVSRSASESESASSEDEEKKRRKYKKKKKQQPEKAAVAIAFEGVDKVKKPAAYAFAISIKPTSVEEEPLPIPLPVKAAPSERFEFKEVPDILPGALGMLNTPKIRTAYRAFSVAISSPENHNSPDLYMHAALFFLGKRTPEALGCALRCISNLAELELDNAAPLRLAAALCAQAGLCKETMQVLERVLRLRPEEPQSHRDLAVAVHALGVDTKLFERTLALLNSVVEKEWDKRFEQVEVVAIQDMNGIYRKLESAGLAAFVTHNVFADFVKVTLDTDIRIVLTWTADGSDVDLVVKEPSGEVCTPFHNQTMSGAMQSRDMPGGFGPVEYLLRNAKPGRYDIQARLFALPPNGSTVFATVNVYTDWARPTQAVQTITRAFPNTVRSTISFGTLIVKS